MIARIAPRAIWRPKLADTFFTPNASAFTARVRLDWKRLHLARRERLGAERKSRYASPGPDEARGPGSGASAWPILAASSRTTSSETGCGVVKVTCVPPRKSIPRFSPLTPIAPSEMRTTAAGDREPRVAPADVVELQPARDAAARGAHDRGLSSSLKPASTARNARVARTAVSIDIAVPTRSISAKPRTLAVATANSTSAVIAVTTFASTIVAKPFV